MRRRRFETGKIPCVRCNEPMFNEFRRQPYCLECGLELQQMSFTGEEVLEMVMQMMPPTPPHPDMPVKVMTVLTIARKVLIDRGILDEPTNDDKPNNKSPMLV